MERVTGLGLVLASMTLFYGMTDPAWIFGRSYACAIAGIAAVCGTFFGMPLLIIGRIRQRR
jgi:type IV secretory pathway VirB3-like protein